MPGLDRFDSLCDGVFAEPVASFGFTCTSERNDDDHASRTYRAGDRYIVVFANTYFRDGPPHCGIHLGEGSDEWPETDWNKIALWQLVGTTDHLTDVPRSDYPLESLGELSAVLQAIRSNLLTNAQDFLAGSLERFRLARARMNQQREPYKIYTSDESGKYSMRYDEESAELKRRFS
jgi:hypothetical protein